MSEEFTRYRLRDIAERADIDVRYAQFSEFIDKGLLPDPNETPWVESEIVPRLMRINELKDIAWSLDRRLVHLYLERFPVLPAKLQAGMAGMIPTIQAPIRKLNAIEQAEKWFSSLPGNWTPGGRLDWRVTDWKRPPKEDWANILCSEGVREFESRVGTKAYFAQLLEQIGKGTSHALIEIPLVERLTLMMVNDLARSQASRRHFRELEDMREQKPE